MAIKFTNVSLCSEQNTGIAAIEKFSKLKIITLWSGLRLIKRGASGF